MDKNLKIAVFFIIMLFLVYASLILSVKLKNSKTAIMIIGLVFTSVMIGVFFLVSLNVESFWEPSIYSQCKGGPYMWQGNSPTAKACRALAETPQGRCGISSYNCAKGFVGQPGFPFIYTPLSGDSWENERCDREDCEGCSDPEALSGDSWTKTD